MRTLTLVLAFAFVAAPAFAKEGARGHGACKAHWEACKDAKGKEKFKCMKDAATAANDQACLDEMAKHGKHKGTKAKHEHDKAESGQEGGEAK